MTNAPQTSRAFAFLQGGGALGQVMRDTDWSATPLGPIADWSQPLLTALSVMLAAPQPSYIFWGPELGILYNAGCPSWARNIRLAWDKSGCSASGGWR